MRSKLLKQQFEKFFREEFGFKFINVKLISVEGGRGGEEGGGKRKIWFVP